MILYAIIANNLLVTCFQCIELQIMLIDDWYKCDILKTMHY